MDAVAVAISAFPGYKNFIQVELQLGELVVCTELSRGVKEPKRKWPIVVPVFSA
jgi:hypothetical protein